MSLKDEFLSAMSRQVSTVTVVTTDGPAGARGATVSAMTSVSADGEKPTLLICLHHDTKAASAILENGCYCVNILSQEDQHLSNIFASRTNLTGAEKFDGQETAEMSTGSPALSKALVNFDCKLQSHERVGTHFVMIGAVQSISQNDGEALLYGDRNYRASTPLD